MRRTSMICIDHFALSDTGRMRKENQDSFGAIEDRNFFLVCDGMGGGAAGDFASKCATDIILKSFDELSNADVRAVNGELPIEIGEEFERPIAAFRLANRILYNYSQRYPKLAGMGTTAVAALFDLGTRRLHMYNVGDSRLYRIRNSAIVQLTTDHTKVNELVAQGKMREDEIKTAEIQSMITRALGTSEKVKIDYQSVELLPDDIFVMCTDGLNGELSDEDIRIITLRYSANMEVAAMRLIETANTAGGRDNTTVITLRLKNADFENNITYPIPVQSLTTLGEETAEQSASEDRILKPLANKAKIVVPSIAKDKSLFSNPLIMGLVLTVLIVGVAIFPKKVITGPETTLNTLVGKISGIVLDVRIPNDAQLAAYKKSEDSIQKLQLIQDWFKNKETTRPLESVTVTLVAGGKQQFSGVTNALPLNVSLPVGNYTLRLTRRNYRIVNEHMFLINEINVMVEPAVVLKPVVVIMVPVNE